MSPHIIARITNLLEKQFQGKIDMSDYTRRSAAEQRQKFLSRALAALCVRGIGLTDVNVASLSLTDEYGDGGIDAIYFDQASDTLILVQTKWNENGDKPIDAAGCLKFVAGVRDLLDGRFDNFGDRIRKKEAEVKTVLWSERPIRIRLVTAHTAAQETHEFVKRKVLDFVDQLNEVVVTASADFLNQAGVYGLITSGFEAAPIKLQFGLRDWGHIDQPYQAYYGRVHINDVHKWWQDHGNGLFRENLRVFHYSSEVNDALRGTLDSNPEDFWYFNNGITIIANSVTPALYGTPGRKFGVFTCDGVSVVNGAQTVGTIGSTASLPLPTTEDETVQPWVQLRIISLDRCPSNFGRLITRAANLQNAVGNREFAAMDPQQQRLATEFALDLRRYVYKSGERDPRGEEGCGIIEATQALACAQSAGLAVQVKREIGLLWADTTSAPYTDLFNNNTTSTRIWRSVLIMRSVDEELQKLRSHPSPRSDMVAIHMNRAILHLVFQDPAVKHRPFESGSELDLVAAGRGATLPAYMRVSAYLEQHHKDDYLASLSKNSAKCEAMVKAITSKDPSQQADLFTPLEAPEPF